MDNKVFCFFSACYLPHMGGVERYTYSLARELCNRGNEVIVVTSSLKSEKEYEQDGNITIIRLPSFQLLGGRFPVLKFNRLTRVMLKKLSAMHIDYVIINTRYHILSYYGAKFAQKRGLPSIVIEHGTGHLTVNNPFLDILSRFYEHITTFFLKRVNKNFCGVSKECNKWLQHFGIKAKGLLYNSVDMEQIEALLSQNNKDLLENISYAPDDFIVTYTGRLLEEKGVRKLVKAVKVLRARFPNLKLCVAGDGDLYSELKEIKGDWIKVLGRLDYADVIQLLKHSNIYCLPTDYPEGLPTSVLEAIACKVYVITTQNGGSKEIIINKSYGTILHNNSIEEIGRAIAEVIEDPARADTVVENAYHRLRDNFSWERTCNDLIDAFH